MNTTVPPEFRARFTEHNRHAVFSGILTAIFAAACWGLFYFFLRWLAQILAMTAWGGMVNINSFVLPAFLILSFGLLLVAALDHALFRFAPLNDREIFGLHLLKEFPLMLPKLTLAAFGNLLAYRALSREDLRQAWVLLQRIQQDRRAEIQMLTQVEPDARRLNALLLALQFVGFIDLHHGEESWFYLVRSDQAPIVNAMIQDCPDYQREKILRTPRV
ncbi:MAG: hypothetical protein ABI615_09140 [Chthoniobacterales bacterium]